MKNKSYFEIAFCGEHDIISVSISPFDDLEDALRFARFCLRFYNYHHIHIKPISSE